VDLGEYLNQYLNEHNLSIRKFAEKAGISHSYIAYIVNGKTSRGKKPVLTIDKLKQISSAMGMDVNELIASVDADIQWPGRPEAHDLTSEEWDLVQRFRRADARDRDHVKYILDRYSEDTALSAG
jgi:transcriptional regulator with XRE-family HTH domain